jgi:hypothetical protein
MAWGIWNKIKNGLKKVGSWVNDKVVKPVKNYVGSMVEVTKEAFHDAYNERMRPAPSASQMEYHRRFIEEQKALSLANPFGGGMRLRP